MAIVEAEVENKTSIMQSYFNPLNYYVAPNQVIVMISILYRQKSYFFRKHQNNIFFTPTYSNYHRIFCRLLGSKQFRIVNVPGSPIPISSQSNRRKSWSLLTQCWNLMELASLIGQVGGSTPLPAANIGGG